MGDQRSRLGAANLTIPLMLLTFVLMVGFLWWLNQNAQSAAVVVTEEPTEDTAAASGTAEGVQVTEENLRMTPEQFEGQVVRITLAVAAPVGPEAFFLDVTDSPFLVKISDELVAQGQAVPQGEVTVSGPLMAMTDSIRGAWVAEGIIPPADEVLVEFATHFIEANTIQAAAAPAAETPPSP